MTDDDNGNGKLFNSLKSVAIPAKIDHKNIEIVTNVIDSELPLLKMEMAKAKTDSGNGIINVFGEYIKISFTASGYHFMAICLTNQATVDIAEDNCGGSIPLNIADTSSSTNDDELLKLFVETENCCEICTKYKQPGLKPIVGFSLSKEFNDTVSVDFKEI